jgi:nicotinamidase-related amidase
VAHKNSSIHTKYEPNAFSIDSLQTFLKDKGIDTILLSGIVTENGVLKTAEALVTNGYNVITINDATGSRENKTHDDALTRLDIIGDVESAADLHSYLAKG